MHVHPTAIIAEGAELGEGVSVGPYCVVGPQVRLGDGCRLHSHVVIEGDTVVGPECEFFPHAVVGTHAQHKVETNGPPGRLRIGARNRFREFVTVHVGSAKGHGVTSLGDDNFLLASAHVAHDCTLGSGITMTNGAMAAGHTIVQDQAVIGAMVGLHQFVRVGRLAMLGAGAMAPRDVPPYALVHGDRAKIRGVNVIGMRRAGISQEDVATVKRAYRMLFWQRDVMAKRIEATRQLAGDHPLVRDVLAFMEDTKRGVLMARGRMEMAPEEESA